MRDTRHGPLTPTWRAAAVALAAALALSLPALRAAADVSPPCEVRLSGDLPLARAGVPLAASLVIQAGEPGIVSGFQIGVGVDGWAAASWQAPGEIPLAAGEEFMVPFEITPLLPDLPLTGSLRFNGQTVRIFLDLSPAAQQRAIGIPLAVRVPPGTPLPPEVPDAAPPAPLRISALIGADPRSERPTGESAPTPPRAGDVNAARTITVTGRFAYRRPDGQVVGADQLSARVRDAQDPSGPRTLTYAHMDAGGNFTATVDWTPALAATDADPDLFIEFTALAPLANFNLMVGRDSNGNDWTWRTPVTWDLQGASWDVGAFMPPTMGPDHQAVHAFTTARRSYRWAEELGYPTTNFVVQVPAGNTEYSRWFGNTIRIETGDWDDSAISHEFGHHWVHIQAGGSQNPDYCNGTCDTDGCSHCIWCAETDHDAWNEGLPDFLGQLIPSTFEARYKVPSNYSYRFEDVGRCANAFFDDPTRTEGFLASLVWDIFDGPSDAHAGFSWSDQLALGIAPILESAHLDQPKNPVQFIQRFAARNPGLAEALWQTQRNCGYDALPDFLPPGAITNLGSPTHQAGGFASPNPRITVTWTPPADDVSGIAGYSYVLSNSGPAPDPDDDAELTGQPSSFITQPLAPGNWWIGLRAIDRTGKAGPVAWAGPFGIRTALANNLYSYAQAGWGAPVVARRTPDAAPGFCPYPDWLPGDGTFYLNSSVLNFGEQAAEGSTTLAELDGDFLYLWPEPAVGSYGVNSYVNDPQTARGGRHTLSVFLDVLNVIPETDETDNDYGIQFGWRPGLLVGDTPIQRQSPPQRFDGIETLPGGATFHENCDGVRVESLAPDPDGGWTAVWMHALDDAVDYDLRLHTASETAGGFWSGSQVASSAYGGGALDVVLVNGYRLTARPWDVGVVDYTGVDFVDYRLGVARGAGIGYGDSLTLALGSDELLRLYEVTVFPAQTGPLSLVVRLADPSQGPVHLAWLDQSLTTFGIGSASAMSSTDPVTGIGRLDVNAGVAAVYGIAVWRDPPGAGGGEPLAVATADAVPTASGKGREGRPAVTAGPIAFTLEAGPTPLDYAVYPASWYAPLVPRPDTDGYWTATEAPTSLVGDGTTWLNLAARGLGPVAVSEVPAAVFLDGVEATSIALPVNPFLLWAWSNNDRTLVVPGGRHTLAMKLDAPGIAEEISETNNLWGEQWVWTPANVSPGGTGARPAPPGLLAGVGDVTTAESFVWNCDALRLQPSLPAGSEDGRWHAVAAMPADAADVDVRLHEASGSAKAGFDAPLAHSTSGPGESDYAIVHWRATLPRALDTGFLGWSGATPYVWEAVASIDRGPGVGMHGPFTLEAGRIVQLHDFALPAGSYLARLENLSGTVRWGLTFHDGRFAFDHKLGSIDGHSARGAGPGGGALLDLDVAEAGRHCLAVWKEGTDDLPLAGQYRLVIEAGTLAAPDDAPAPPVSARLLGARPNPFSPRTSIAFELPSSGRASVMVYDIHGRRVRVLARGEFAAGHHDLSWDGTDDDGHSLPNGLYLVRLQAGAHTDHLKIVRGR